MKTSFLTLMAALLILAACSKPKPTPEEPHTTVEVTGYMLTTDSLDPAPNCNLQVDVHEGYITLPGVGNQLITDEEGIFRFNYTGPKNGDLSIYFSGTDKYHNTQLKYLKPHQTPNPQLLVRPLGWLKVHVKNVDVQSPNDYLGISVGGGNYELLYGIVDKTIFWETPGNGYVRLTYTVIKNGVETKNEEFLYIVGFDTTFYQIHY